MDEPHRHLAGRKAVRARRGFGSVANEPSEAGTSGLRVSQARRGLIAPEEIVKLGFGLAMAMEEAEAESGDAGVATRPALALHHTAA